MAAYGAVDWGTSSFRLWLLDRAGTILAERRSQQGMVAAAEAGFGSVLDSHLQAVGAGAALPVVVCGMAGARQGWAEAGYVDTPAPLASLAARAVRVPDVARGVFILPGIAQRDPACPDVMRGEETQLLGAAGMAPRATVCLPGTHSKWVVLENATVTGFATAMTGELFEAVTRHTILSHSVAGAEDALDEAAFVDSVREADDHPALATTLLFRARAAQLLHGIGPQTARERISGALIGAEIAAHCAQDEITLVASGRLRHLYRLAFDALALPVREIEADEAARRGLHAAASSLFPHLVSAA